MDDIFPKPFEDEYIKHPIVYKINTESGDQCLETGAD